MKKNINLDAMLMQFTYAPMIKTPLRKALIQHMVIAENTLYAREQGGNAMMTEDEIDKGMRTFEQIYDTLCDQQRKEEEIILNAIEDMPVRTIRRYNLWSIAIDHNVTANMGTLLEMAHKPYNEDDDINVALAGAAAASLQTITEKMDTLQRLRDIYADAAMI